MTKFYSGILKNVLLPAGDLIMGTRVASSYRLIRKMEEFSSEQVREWQNIQLCKLINHAYHHTSYYKELFKKSGIIPDDIRSIDDLINIPVLEKRTIQQNFERIIPDNINNLRFKISATGGSTGNPMKYYLDYSSWSIINANNIINWEKAGYEYGKKYIALGSTALLSEQKISIAHNIYYSLKNKISLSGINMSEAVCRSYITIIKRKKVKFIYGYASSIYLLADYAITSGEVLDISACFCTSEVLTNKFRNTIQRAFRCLILDCYGANDGGVTAFEHIPGQYEVGYNCIVQVCNQENSGCGPALLTDLFNYSMPLINYMVGDEIELSKPDRISAKYNGQIINKIIGRISDIIKLENGRILTGPAFTVLFKNLPVEHYFIKKTGINSIVCFITKQEGFEEEHEKLIISTFKKHIGKEASFSINYTTDIITASNGKRKYFDAGDSNNN